MAGSRFMKMTATNEPDFVTGIEINQTSHRQNKGSAVAEPLSTVRMIGLEPTCREALAPETSVSTISPHPRQKVGANIENLLNSDNFYARFLKSPYHTCTHSPNRQH